MKLEIVREQGRQLNADDLFEFREMYYNGEHTVNEICGWFGITNYEFHIYKDIVEEIFYKGE